jgi:hypothetical protein
VIHDRLPRDAIVKKKNGKLFDEFSGERTKRTSEKADVCIAWTTHA